MASQMKPKERRAQILAEAVRQSAKVGYQNIARDKIAAALDISPALVSRHMGTMPDLKMAVLADVAARAARGAYSVGAPGKPAPSPVNDMAIVAQGIVAKERRMLRLPEKVRALALHMQSQ